MVKKILTGGILLISLGCTPAVKEITLKKEEVVIVKKGSFLFSEEEKSFIKREAQKLGIVVPENKEIEKHLRQLLKDKRSLELALRRANLYIPYIKPILIEHNLPEELALLPLIESKFNPFAVSPSGAAGLWQIMPSTARRYGLIVSKEVDERFDLIKSTRTAALYLRDLYSLFNSWELALAAYNCGEGCVKRRTGGKDFWKKKHRLPHQTRKYVPKFFAALLVVRSPERYGLKVKLDTFKIKSFKLKENRKVKNLITDLKIKEAVFRDMNPHLRGDYVPAGSYVYIPEKPTPKEGNEFVKIIVLDNGATLYIKE